MNVTDREKAILTVQSMLDQFHNPDLTARPSGTLTEWFNLSAELGRNKEYHLALEVCLAGLEQQNGAPIFKKNGKDNWINDNSTPHDDLMAHAIQYAQSINDTRLQSLLKLNGYNDETQTGTEQWGWRSYSFTMQALETLGHPDQAIKLGQNYLKNAFVDADTSKVVNRVMVLIWKHGKRGEAIEFGQKWLQDNPNAPSGHIITTLLDWTEVPEDLDAYIALADRGIRDLAEEAASTNLGNLYYRRALARDGRLLGRYGGVSDENWQAEYEQATRDYKMAAQTGLNPVLHEQLTSRILVLKEEADKRSVKTSENATSQTPLDLANQSFSALLSIAANSEAIKAKVEDVKTLFAHIQNEQPGQTGAAIIQSIKAKLQEIIADDDAPAELRKDLKLLWPQIADL